MVDTIGSLQTKYVPVETTRVVDSELKALRARNLEAPLKKEGKNEPYPVSCCLDST